MDYDQLLDKEVRAFIARTAEFYPDDAVELDMAAQRAAYDALCQAFDTGHPDGVRAVDGIANGVPIRTYTAGEPTVTVIYFHGGGFVVGGLDSHDSICAEICAGTGYRVVAVDYRLAPEHLHPAYFDDALAATRWFLATYDGPVVLAGDSAGGNLAAGVAHHTRDTGARIRGQMLIYPTLQNALDRGREVPHQFPPGLTVDDIAFYDKVRSGGQAVMRDARYAALLDEDFSALPPTVIITAECDPLTVDAPLYRDAIMGAGGRAHWIDEPGLIHGYLRARGMSVKAAASFDRIVTGIQCLGQGVWPYDE